MKANLSNWQDSDLVAAAEKYEKENRRDSSFYMEIVSELDLRFLQAKDSENFLAIEMLK